MSRPQPSEIDASQINRPDRNTRLRTIGNIAALVMTIATVGRAVDQKNPQPAPSPRSAPVSDRGTSTSVSVVDSSHVQAPRKQHQVYQRDAQRSAPHSQAASASVRVNEEQQGHRYLPDRGQRRADTTIQQNSFSGGEPELAGRTAAAQLRGQEQDARLMADTQIAHTAQQATKIDRAARSLSGNDSGVEDILEVLDMPGADNREIALSAAALATESLVSSVAQITANSLHNPTVATLVSQIASGDFSHLHGTDFQELGDLTNDLSKRQRSAIAEFARQAGVLVEQVGEDADQLASSLVDLYHKQGLPLDFVVASAALAALSALTVLRNKKLSLKDALGPVLVAAGFVLSGCGPSQATGVVAQEPTPITTPVVIAERTPVVINSILGNTPSEQSNPELTKYIQEQGGKPGTYILVNGKNSIRSEKNPMPDTEFQMYKTTDKRNFVAVRQDGKITYEEVLVQPISDPANPDQIRAIALVRVNGALSDQRRILFAGELKKPLSIKALLEGPIGAQDIQYQVYQDAEGRIALQMDNNDPQLKALAMADFSARYVSSSSDQPSVGNGNPTATAAPRPTDALRPTAVATATDVPAIATAVPTKVPATPTEVAATATPDTKKAIPGISIKADLLPGIDVTKTNFIEHKNLNDPEGHPLIFIQDKATKVISHVVRYNRENQKYEWSEGLKLRDSADILGITVSAKLSNPYINAAQRSSVDSLILSQMNGAVPLYTSWHKTEAKKGSYTFSDADAAVNKAIARGLKVRGDHLVYPYSNFQYTFLKDMKDASRDDLLTVMKDHIVSVMTHFKGRVTTWAVVNEARPPSELNPQKDGPYDYMWTRVGPDYVDQAFAIARATDPTATLIYNETRNEVTGGPVSTDGRLYNSTKVIVDRLKAAGNIDGVGIQMHLNGSSLPNPTDVAKTLKSYGIPVYLTEFNIDMSKAGGTPEEKRNKEIEYYKIFFRAVLLTGVVKEINFWDDAPLMDASTMKVDARFEALNQILAEVSGLQ